MVSRTKVLFFVLFSFLLQFALPSTQASALSFSQCTFSYTDSKKTVIESDCQNKLPEGNYTRKSVQAGKISYFFESEVNDQGLVDKCSAYIVVVSDSNGQGGTIGGTIAEKNAVHCTAIDAGSIKISTTAANNDTRDDAANKVLRTKLADLIQKKCRGLGSADAIDSCNSRALASVDTCGSAALDAANQAATVGGAGTNASDVFIANIVPCISSATGLSESAIKSALGPNIYKEVSDASNNANVSDECVLDEDNKCVDDSEEKSSCAVDGIGWIICPVMNFIGDLNDKAYGFLSNSFLQVDPDLLGDDTEAAWKSFRDIANVLFVIAFLIIIYSQITGGGISNYGLKKMLPKLIIAAILVNTSFILCRVAVDVSNIVGNSIPSFFDVTFSSTAGDTPTTANTDLPLWKDAIGAALIAGTALIGLVLVISLGVPGLIALVIIVLILVARKAAIILLVVIAPLAFVAYLLPNTEQWFKKWWKLFSSLLILYPVIGVVFGASALAAKIINNGDVVMQLTALGVSVLPLFAVPLLLKSSISGLGAVGARLGGSLDRATGAATKGSKDRLKRRGENIEARMAGSDNRFARLAGGYRNRRAFGRKSMETDTARRQQQALTAHVLNNPGNYDPRQLAEAKSASLKEYNEEVGREKSTMSDVDHTGLMNIVKDKNASEERRAAAAGVIGSRSFRKGHQELLDYLGDENHLDAASGQLDSAIKTIQQQTAYDMKDQPIGMGDQDKSALGEGKFTKPVGVNATGTKRTVSQEAMLKRLEEGKLSEQSFASMNPDDLSLIQGLKTDGHLTAAAQTTIDGIIDRLRDPAMATVYASSKENARKVHDTLHS